MRGVAASTLILLAAVLAACGDPLPALPQGDPVSGAALVESLSPNCAQCHVLESAGFTGTAGPDLDELRPGYQRILDAVRDGPGFMPAYGPTLSDAELHDIAAYVSREVGR